MPQLASSGASAAAVCLVHCSPASCLLCQLSRPCRPLLPWAGASQSCMQAALFQTPPLPPPSPNRQEESSVKFQCNDTVKITFDATDNQRVKVTLQYKDAFTQKPVSGRQAS